MDNLNVYIESTIGMCTEYTNETGMQEVSIVISPLKITSKLDALQVSSGCNLWKSCKNKNCQFSLVARPPLVVTD